MPSLGFAEPTLLPPPLARDLSMRALEALAAQMHQLPLETLLIYDFDHVAASALPHLAEQLNMLGEAGWELADTEEKQRALLKEAVALHRLKGTPFAIKRLFALLGLGEVQIDEGRSGWMYNGATHHDGFAVYGAGAELWAVYRVRVPVLLNATQAQRAARMCAWWAPARCHLDEISFSGALIHNAVASYDATFNYGSY